jgi:GxxExxY protein
MTRIDADAPASPPGGYSGTLIDAELTRRVIGAFYEVYNALGHGFLESVYSGTLARELTRRGVAIEREVGVDVRYKGEVVGVVRADMLVESRLVLEIKATAALGPADRRQLLNYLRCTGLELGLLLGFGHRAVFQRVIATNRGHPAPR